MPIESRNSSGTTLASSSSNNNGEEEYGKSVQQDHTSSQIQMLNSFATPFPYQKQQKLSELDSSPPLPNGIKNNSDPMGWMSNEEDLSEEWVSEPEPEEEEEEVNSINENNMDTTKQHVSVKNNVQTPEWKKALNFQSQIPVNPKSSLENLFKPPTTKQKKLDDIPESTSFNNDTVRSKDVDSSQDEEGDGYNHNNNEDSSKGLSSSPLKLFQKHDTYTNSRFEGLLGSLDDKSKQSSSKSSTTNNNIQNNIGNEVTTQDYMNHADELFNRIRANHNNDNDNSDNDNNQLDTNNTNHINNNTNNNDFSTSNATTYTDYSSNNNHHQEEEDDQEEEEYSSLHELEYSLKQHYPEPDNYYTSTSSESNNDNYFNSIKKQYENSSTSLQQKQQPNRNHPAMALIGPDDVKGIIPENLGSMDFDRDNMRWRRKTNNTGGTFSATDFGTGSTKVDTDNLQQKEASSEKKNNNSESDVFEGIDDLSDEKVKKKKSLDEQPSELNNNNNKENKSPHGQEEGIIADATTEIERDDYKNYPEIYITPGPSKILGNSTTITTNNSKREVSFKIPSSHFKSTPLSFNQQQQNNVTNISQIDTSHSLGYGALIKVLTELGRDEPYWDQYENLQLTGLGLDSLMKLDEICPMLKNLEVSNNKLSFVTGIPGSLRSLIIANNNLTDLASFGQLSNLQYLSLANNRYERLNGLANLTHLRELNVDNNHIISLDGISHLDGLIRLSVSGNDLCNTLNFSGYSWRKLEDLILTGNNIKRIKGLDSLPNLNKLTLDDNEVEELLLSESKSRHKKLRKLSLKNNQLEEIDISAFVGLKELQLDQNNGVEIIGIEKLTGLERLSVRYQNRSNKRKPKSTTSHNDGSPPPGYSFWTKLSDVRKLNLSGNVMNKLPTLWEPFLNLQVLELSGMGLKTLPKYFDEFMINLRELDLSFNSLKDITCLGGIPKLKRLYLYSNKIESMDHLIDCVNQWAYITVLDLRHNPITEAFYPPLLEETIITRRLTHRYQKTRTKAAQQSWSVKDQEFLSEIIEPNALQQRKKYQGIVLAANNKTASLRWLDGWLMKSYEKEQLANELERKKLL